MALLKRIGATVQLTSGRLTSLRFDEVRRKPGVSDLLCLQHLTHLQQVDFYGTHVTVEVLQALASLPELQSISLNCCRLIDDTAIHALSGLQSLNALYLMDTAVTDATVEQLKGFDNLRRLRVDGTKQTGKTVARLLETHRLEELWLDGDQASPRCIEHIVQCESLRSLALIGPSVTDETVAPLAAATFISELSILRARITDKSIQKLSALVHLRTLGLNDCAGVTDAAKFDPFGALEQLWLQNTGITVDGLNALKAVCHGVSIWPTPQWLMNQAAPAHG
jgi:Leucine-rich repeat (LRR) protein